MSDPKGWTYKAAGVDIDAQNEGLRRAKGFIRSTFNERVLTDLGSFGGLFAAGLSELEDPVLASSCDGVGTKLKLAFRSDRHGTVGQDLVNHCVNDILVLGAKPLFFLDYFASGALSPTTLAAVIEGLAKACRENETALIGGETAEMPGMYAAGEYDLAGFIVGAVDRRKIIDGQNIEVGDRLIGIASTGLHTNGYSLAQKVLFEAAALEPHTVLPELGETIIDALLRVHRSYRVPILRLLDEGAPIRAMVHITGGGFYDNIPRVFPDGKGVHIDGDSWPIPPLFRVILERGGVAASEAFRVFNMGIGYILVVPAAEADAVGRHLSAYGEHHWQIGEVVSGEREVEIFGIDGI